MLEIEPTDRLLIINMTPTKSGRNGNEAVAAPLHKHSLGGRTVDMSQSNCSAIGGGISFRRAIPCC